MIEVRAYVIVAFRNETLSVCVTQMRLNNTICSHDKSIRTTRYWYSSKVHINIADVVLQWIKVFSIQLNYRRIFISNADSPRIDNFPFPFSLNKSNLRKWMGCNNIRAVENTYKQHIWPATIFCLHYHKNEIIEIEFIVSFKEISFPPNVNGEIKMREIEDLLAFQRRCHCKVSHELN